MLTTREQKIMEILLPQPFKACSIRQINTIIKGSYALTHRSVKSLIQKKLIKSTKIGNSLSCQVNLSADPQLLAISSLTHSQGFLRRARFSFIVDEINETLSHLYIIALFGSYAKGMAKRGSDIDFLFIIQHEHDIESMRKKVTSVLTSTNMSVEFEIVTTEWLLKMFEEKNTVGREVLEGSIILHGAEQYYTLVRAYDQKRGH